jgi:PAS domain S-box-containing protein
VNAPRPLPDDRFRALFERAPQAMWVTDAATNRFVLVNRAAVEHYGYSEREFLAMSLEDIRPPEDVPALRLALAGHRDVSRRAGLWRHRRKDGSVIVVEAVTSLLTLDGRTVRLSSITDITERADAELLRAQLAAIVEQSDDAIIMVDLDGRITSWNHGAVRMYGHPPQDAIGELLTIIEPPDRPGEIHGNLAQVLAGEPVQHETTRRRRDGSLVDVSISVTPIRGPGGDVVGVSSIARDITERRRAEEALRTAEARYRTLVEQIPAVTYVDAIDPPRTLYISPQVEELGLSREEWLANPRYWRQALHPEDRDRATEDWTRFRRNGGIFEAEYRLLAGDGRPRWVHDRAVLLLDDEGRASLIQGVIVDVTDRRKAEEALRRSEERLRLMATNATDAVFAYDMDRRLVFANPAVERLYGYPPDELDRRGFIAWGHPDDRDRIRSMWEDLFRGQAFSGEEYRIITRDGQERWVSGTWGPILDEEGRQVGVQGVDRDVTERRRAETALREAEARFRTLVEQVPAIVYNADFGMAGAWTYVSPQIEELLGYSPEEWMGDPTLFDRLLHPDDRAAYLGEEQRAQETGRLAAEYRLVARDGTVRWFRDDATVVHRPDGGTFLRGLLLDISEARRTEEELERSLSLLEATLESTADGILVVDREGRTLSFNRRFAEMWRIPDDLLESRDDVRMLGFVLDQLSDPDAFVAKVRELYSHPDAESSDTIEFVDGRVFDRYSKPQRIAGISVGRVWSFRDVTERASAEARFRAIVETSLDAVVTMDTEGRITGWNPQAEATFGWQEGDVLGRSLGEVIVPPKYRERHSEGLRRYLATGESSILGRRIELSALHQDGHEFPVELAVTSMRRGGDLTFSGFVRDITDRQRAEAELQESLDVLRETMKQRQALLVRLQRAQEEERERIAGDIHDDSIQVMASVGMRLSILRRRLVDPRQRQAVDQLEDTVQLAIGRLRHLLFELRPPALDRVGLAAALRLYLEGLREESGAQAVLTDRLVQEPPLDARIALYRVAQEALANVRKHAQAHHVEVLLEERDRGVCVSIRDDGRGFSPDEAERHRPGHLGLTAMRERTQTRGGWFRLDSAPGSGTTVEFWMPVAIEPATAPA